MKNNEVCINFDITEDLSMPSIKVLLAMAGEMDSKCRVSISVKVLSEKTGYSERSIKRALKELKNSDAIHKGDTVYSISDKYIKIG